MKENVFITTDNVFADLGLDDSEEIMVRSDLMSEIVDRTRKSKLPQKEVASILSISEPKISALMSGKINDFSTDELVGFSTKLEEVSGLAIEG
jgi:predicted XRE-type DNA-binding protein